MQRKIGSQAVWHLPSLSFMALLAMAVFLLPDEELLPPVAPKTVAQDVVWTRTGADGEIMVLRAPLLQREPDGSINARQVILQSERPPLTLRGEHGSIDTSYAEIQLQSASGEVQTKTGDTLALSLASARLQLDGSLLTGENVILSDSTGNRFVGDTLRWQDHTVHIQGNVKAVYSGYSGQ